VARSDATTDAASRQAITRRDVHTGTWNTSPRSILAPTKTRTAANPSFRYTKRVIIPARRKYRARTPRMAKAFDVNTRNGSSVTAKIAGMESTANTTSVVSPATSTASIGVA
jgi:hypothetical protein